MSFISQPWLLKRPLPAPSLDLNFLATTLDSRITFTRAAGPATYFDGAGTIQTAGTNIPRFDYDPVTHAPRGLLIEEARTNNAVNSSAVGTGAWSLNALTATANAATAPDGTVTATLLAETATAASHYITLTVPAVVAAQIWTFSIYLKAVGGSLPFITNNAEGQVSYNLGLGTFSGSGGSIQPVGNGWYRCSQVVTKSNTNGTVFIALSTGFGSFAGSTATSLYAWGGQWELGAFATSYIPTTSAAVTRSADVATMPTGAWFNASGPGSWAAQVLLEGQNSSGNGRIIGTGGTGATPLFYANGGFAGSYDGAAAIQTVNIVGSGSIMKMASSWSASVGHIAFNGGTAANGAQASGFGAFTTFSFLNGGGAAADGWLQRVRYWPRALAEAELQQVTA